MSLVDGARISAPVAGLGIGDVKASVLSVFALPPLPAMSGIGHGSIAGLDSV